MLAAAGRPRQGRLPGEVSGNPGRGPRLSWPGRPEGAADRPATAGRPRRRSDPRDAAALSRHRDHGDFDPRRRGERDRGDHRRRHRLSAQGRVSDRHCRDRPRPRRRALADLGIDRALHRAANPEPARAAAGTTAQHRQADAARDRHPLGHWPRASAMPRSRAISACRARPSPDTSRASTASSRSIPAARPYSRRCSRA